MRRQAELVLLGNILLADYEQQRVDPIVRSALSLFPSRLLNDDADESRLLTVRDKKPWALQDTGAFANVDRRHVRVDRHEVAHGDRPACRRVRSRCTASYIRVGLGLPKPRGEGPLYRRPGCTTLQDPALVDDLGRARPRAMVPIGARARGTGRGSVIA